MTSTRSPIVFGRPHDSSEFQVVKTMRTSGSEVTRAIVDGHTVYIKQYREGHRGNSADVIRARVAREIDLLQRLTASNLFGNRLGLVRVLEAKPEQARLVSAEVTGEPLLDVLARHRWRPSTECLRALYSAGKWLRQFQSVQVRPHDLDPIGSFDPADLHEYCDLRIQKLHELGSKWPLDSVHRQIGTALRQRVAASSEEDRRHVWAHSDYCSPNILWDGAVLTPIDFEMVDTKWPLHDVTYFIHRLEMLQVYRPWKRWPIKLWTRTFLKGFGRLDAEQSPVYQALMIRHLLCRLLTYVRRQPRDRKQALHDISVRWAVKHKLLGLVRDTLGTNTTSITARNPS